ncbi:Ig-like domain-containing protein, partial [Pseudooceanicola sp. MF1-13]|uniref:Ig-like domain-containing protein n=1 Tax=Pseudooceanicola sp. MF1-13 TaxID=3379095 RepID=UPI0038915F1B
MTGFFFWDWLKHDYDTSGSGSTTTNSDLRDGYVEGTTGDDTIGAGYTDADGDKIDANDALILGETGDDDIVIAGNGADKVYSGEGNDEVYGGGMGDTVLGGRGDDVIYGDETRDSAPAGSVSKTYDCKDLWDYSHDYTSWFDWGNIVCKKLSYWDQWDNHLTFNLDKSVSLKSLVFDNAHYGAKVKIFAEDGKVLFEGQVSTSLDLYKLDLDLDGAFKIEVWTDKYCTLKSIDYTQGGFDGIDGGQPGDDSLLGGSGDDTIYGNEGNDTIKGEHGEDVLFGNSGDDYMEGGKGADVMYGDNGINGGGSTGGGSGERESFEWDKAPDPDGYGAIDNGDNLSGGFVQNTGSVDVTFSIKTTNESPTTKFQTDQQKVHSITTDGTGADAFSSMASRLDSNEESATYQWGFSTEVGNTSFRINDIDADSKVIIKAYDVNGNLVDISVQAESGTHLTLSDLDGAGGKEVVTHYGDDTSADTDPAHSVLVNIAAPIVRLEVTHTQNGHDTSEINVTDIYFDALEGTVGNPGGGSADGGDDTMLGGSGDDSMYGNMGDDEMEGGAGADIIYGDNAEDVNGNGGGDRESFNWQGYDDATADAGFVQNTGSVNVTYARIKDTNEHISTVDDATELNTSGIDGGGETVDSNSGLKSETKGHGNEGDFQWTFDQAVTNVEFNINDLDTDGVVKVIAFGPDGQQIPVDLNAGSGIDVNGSIARSNQDVDRDEEDAANNLQVSIDGPVSKIIVEHSQDGSTNSGIWITDIYFDAPGTAGDGFNGEGGDDTITGGEGADMMYGEGGDDTFVVSSADEGAGDHIVGGNGPDQNTDIDTLDLRGAGQVTITEAADANDNFATAGTVTFSDGRTLTFEQIERILKDDPQNAAPVATDDTASGDENTTITVNVLSNDSDPDGDALTVTQVTGASNGTATVVNNQVVYTPNAGFVGTETLTYTVTDGDLTDTATITITVNDVADAPTAEPDTATTEEDTSITINALENDSDPQNDPLTISDVTGATNGSATVIGNQVVYTPDADFNGTETLTYTVTDPDGNTDTATITVNVTPVNDAPVANDDQDTTDEDTAVTIDVLGNDTDVDDAKTDLTVSIEPGQEPTNGTATVLPTGQIQFTPDAGFTGTETFSYTLTDPDGATDTATVSVKVNEVDEAPVAVDDAEDTPEDTSIIINALENDSDPQNDPLTISDVTGATNGTATVIGNQVVYTPDADFNGTETLTYTVTDPDGNTDTATITVNVTPVNDAPVAEDDMDTTDKDTAVTIDVLANDTDVDDAKTDLTVSIEPGQEPTNGTATVLPTGQIQFTPDAGFTGTETFSYTLTDPDGETDTATVSVKVNEVDEAPVAVDDAEDTPEDTAIIINALENDSDPQNDPLTITDVTGATNGTATVIGNQVVYTPDADFNGTETLTYTVTDPDGNTDTATITVNVTPVNDAPVANDDQDTTDEDTAVTIDVLGNDTDVDDVKADLTVSIEPGQEPTNGTATVLPTGQIQFTPDAGFTGTETFSYTLTDPDGETDTATVSVKVNEVDEAPVAVDDAEETPEDTAIIINALENDSDPQNDPLTITDVTGATNGTATVIGNQVVYTPNDDFNGTETLTYTVTDPDGNTDTATITVDVTPVNDAPVAEDDMDTTDKDTAVTIDVLANDTDVDDVKADLTVSIEPGQEPTNGTATVLPNGQIQFTPNAGFTGTETFSYTLTDPDGETDTATVSVKVNEVDEAPVAVDDAEETPEDTAIIINALENDSDPQNDPLTITDVTGATNGTATVIGNQVVYTPNDDFNGTETLTYTVTDPDGNTDTATITVNVTPVNDAPVAEDDMDSTDKDTAVTIDVLANDTDVDDAKTDLTVSIEPGQEPTNGTATVLPTGQIQFTPDAGFTGTETFSYTLTDPDGETDTATVSVKVNEVDDAPTAEPDTATTAEDTSITINALENDSDPQNDPLTISDVTGATNGSATVIGNQVVYTPDADFNGTETLTYTVTDPDGNTDTATITVNVTPVNDAPVANDDQDTTDEDTAVTIDVLGNDTDVDDAKADLTVSIEPGQEPTNGTATVLPNGQIQFTPNAGFTGTETFSYTLTDPDGATDTATVSVKVNEVDDAPTAEPDTATTAEDNAITINALANDSDPQNDPLSITNVTGAQNGTATV